MLFLGKTATYLSSHGFGNIHKLPLIKEQTKFLHHADATIYDAHVGTYLMFTSLLRNNDSIFRLLGDCKFVTQSLYFGHTQNLPNI